MSSLPRRWIQAFILPFVFFLVQPAGAQTGHIVLDEDFSDWAEIEPLWVASFGGYFNRLWVTNDEDYLYLSLEINGQDILQESAITLWIDTDNDPATGASVGDIGADLSWNFGNRNGTFVHGGTQTAISHRHIGVVNAPTVSSDRFEIAIRRDARPNGQNLLFPSNEIRLILHHSDGGGVLPPANTGISYTFQEIERDRPRVSLARHPDAHLRVVAYNSERDALFDFHRRPAYRRIFEALQPDLIGFSEIYIGTAEQVAAAMDDILPIEGGWYTAKVFHDGGGGGNDLVLASRYPIIDAQPVIFRDNRATRTGVFTVDLRPDFDTDMMVFVSHPNCCTSNLLRQEQLDAKMAFLRDWKAAPTTVPGTPFMHIGDMNLVTFEHQRRTILHGEIVNAPFLPSFAPDWDGTSLRDLKPLVTGAPMTFTWYDESSAFSPGRLDYIIYSGATLESLNGFSLFTPTMTPEELSHYGLLANDVIAASDHLPIVGDFVFTTIETSVEGPAPDGRVTLDAIYPNPTAGRINLSWTAPEARSITLEVSDVLGRVLRTEVHEAASGRQSHSMNLSGLPAGMYLIRLRADEIAITRRVVLTNP